MVEELAQRTVLLLGEGNFSYALARLRLHLAVKPPKRLNLVATSFDSESDLFSKYPESVQILQRMRDLQKKESQKL